jgi:hypothetical protein
MMVHVYCLCVYARHDVLRMCMHTMMCMYVYAHVNTYRSSKRIGPLWQINTHTHTHIHTYIHAVIYTYIHVYKHIQIIEQYWHAMANIHTYINTHTQRERHINIYKHAYMYTNTYRLSNNIGQLWQINTHCMETNFCAPHRR